MQIERTGEGSFSITEVEPPLVDILMSIPEAADPGESAAASGRLFPEPATGRDGSGIREEWRDYVQPELRERFENAATAVEVDLEQLRTGETLTIAAEHVDAWLNTLNQARLVLAARFNVTESDMERPVSHLLESERDFALFQIHLYGFLQECLVRGIESEEPPEAE